MKKAIIKGGIVLSVFLAALIMISSVMNQGNTDMTAEMAGAAFPVVTVDYNGYRINQMHGYAMAMEVSQMRQSITPLLPGRRLGLWIDTYGTGVSGISFEVRSLDGGRLVENTQVEDYEEQEEGIALSFGLKDLIEMDQEYMLVLILKLENGKEVRYYTRVVSTEDYHVEDKLDYVTDFSRKTFDKVAARELTKYMESNADGDNSSFGHVDIHSSFKQVTWGELEVEQETRPQITIQELAEQTGSFWLEYFVSTPKEKPADGEKETEDSGEKDAGEAVRRDGNKNYYRVKEFFRVRYTADRMYLLDYERSMDQIFEASGQVYAANKIMLGITGEEVPVVESDGGGSLAFVSGNRLFCYNVADNKMALLFGFYDQDHLDERTLYDDHGIKILNVDEGGNVIFLAYGYMNRGKHEGESGISLYFYDGTVNTVEELVYIPGKKAQSLLMKEVEQLSYINRNSTLFLKWEDKIYGINVVRRTCEAVVENLAEGSYKVSDSNRMAVWKKSGDAGQGQELVLMNFTSGRQKSIQADPGEILTPIGFMGEDLIYGIARERDIVTDNAGNLIFPMYCVRIENETEGVLMSYQQENVYIINGEVSGNQIILSRVEKTQEGLYESIDDDQIMNAQTVTESVNFVENVVTEKYERFTQIALKGAIEASSMKHLTPREVLFEGSRSIGFQESEELAPRYYVYGKYGLDSIHTVESGAVKQADRIAGVVVNDGGYYVWTKGNRRLSNQIMAIREKEITEIKNSLAVCLDAMLEYEGVVRNSEYMLNRGESALSILEESLGQMQVLDLTGCTLDSVLYYVDQDIPVLVMLRDGTAVLLVGFNEKNTVVMNPETGSIYKVGMNDSREWFEQNGNCFITYVRDPEQAAAPGR